MTKMFIGLVAIVLGVAGSTLIAAPEKNQLAGASGTGTLYVKGLNGYTRMAAANYSSYNCDNVTSITCAYYVTEYGEGVVTSNWYSDTDIANFAYGYFAKLKYVPNLVALPYKGVYQEPEFE